jgi:hypothetical protein
MKAVLHQPYFIPWMGYFSKLVYADKFIVMDNVEFSKRHFIDRVQVINSEGQLIWIGVPIGQHYKEKCNRITFTDRKTVDKMVKTLHSAYTKARHFKDNIQHLENILTESFSASDKLTEINLEIIKRIIVLLELNMPEIILSSKYKEVDNATERVEMLLKETNCDTLITGAGGSLEKHDIDQLAKNGMNILFQDYFALHPTYYQTRRTQLGFAKGLSIVDCILNEGILQTKELLMDTKYAPELYMTSKI